MKNIYKILLISILIISSACSESNTGEEITALTENEILEYTDLLNEMFKTSLMTMTITEGECVMQTKDLKVDLSDNKDHKIELKKTIETSSTKECLGKKLQDENQVEVYNFVRAEKECQYTGTKTGDILEIRSTCDQEISIVDLKEKTFKSTSEKLAVYAQAVSVEREELLGYLENIKIVHFKQNLQGVIKVGKVVVGNANILLNLGL